MQFTTGSSGGLLEGTPTAPGSFPFTVTVTDATGLTQTINLTLAVNGNLQFVTQSNLPSSQVGQSYQAPSGLALQVSGAVGSVSYQLTPDSTLPPGMTLTAGIIGGKPTQAGSYGFTIMATDSNGDTASRTFNININAAPGLTLSLSMTSATGQPISRIDPTLAKRYAKGGTMTMYAGTTGVAYITVTEERGGQPLVGEAPKTTITITADPSRWHPNHPAANLANVTADYPVMGCEWPASVQPTAAATYCMATLNSGNVSAALTVTATATDTKTASATNPNGATVTSNAVSLGVWLATQADQDANPSLVPMGDPDLNVITTSHPNLGNYANPIMAGFLTNLELELSDLTASGAMAACAGNLLPITVTGIALPGGGVFDVDGSPGNYLWDYLPPHGSHQAGGDVDIGVRPIPATCRGALQRAITMAAGQLYLASSYVEPSNDPTSCAGPTNEATGCHWHLRLDITGSFSQTSSLGTSARPGIKMATRPQDAQTPPPVVEQVQFDPTTNLFSYSYSLTNTLPTTDSVDTFKLWFGGNVSSVQNPSGWISGTLGANQGLMWAAASYDSSAANDVEPILPVSALALGASAQGFGFQSRVPPAPTQVSVSTFAPIVGFDSEEELETAFDDLPDNTTTDERYTVAPMGSAPSSPGAMLDDMVGYISVMVNLGWITDPNLAANLTQQLNTISGTVSAGQNSNAVTALTNFISSLSSLAGLTSDAFNVLNYDARYLILQLPTTQATITSLWPTSVAAGGSAFTLGVVGIDFTSGATVQWNGTSLPTTFVSATQLTASVSASLITAVGTASVSVSSGGQTSVPVLFTISSGLETTCPTPTATEGVPYSSQLVGSGGIPPYSWSVTRPSTQPASGLNLNGSSGLVSGTPTITGTLFFYFGITDSTGTNSSTVGCEVVVGSPSDANPSTGPVVTSVSNATSYAAGAVAPGEIVYISGTGMGPEQVVTLTLNGSGLVSTQLDGTSVQFNGIAAPIIYTSAHAVAAVVPYEVTGTSTQVTVTYQGQTSVALQIQVAQSAPGLFTADSSGTGELAAINQDGSVNSASNPAAPGSIVTLFATGEGQTSPAGVDGKLAVAPLPKPLLPVLVAFGGIAANVSYAGGAPGEVAGVMQVNVQLPATVSGPAVPVLLTVGTAQSQTGATLAITGTSTESPAGIYVVSGNGQTASVNQAFSAPLVAQVNNSQGSPLSGIPITWTVSQGTATLLSFLSRICGAILVLGVVPSCDTGQFPWRRRCESRRIVW